MSGPVDDWRPGEYELTDEDWRIIYETPIPRSDHPDYRDEWKP